MKGDFTRETFSPSKHYSSVRMQQGRVQMDADWNEQADIARRRTEIGARDLIGRCGGPLHNPGFHLFVDPNDLSADEKKWLPAQPLPVLKNGDFYIGGGRFYVDGVMIENDTAVAFSAQPDLPSDPLQTVGLYVAYLDVWQRHITALEDPSIKEVALGGPDHGTRTKTIWQLKAVQVAIPKVPSAVSCSTRFDEYDKAVAVPDGRLRARAKPQDSQTDPCILPPGAGFRRLENQLYRVEVHNSGDFGKATFKWSRDNGSVVARIESYAGAQITLTAPGRDQVLGFAIGDWIEVTDDLHELRGVPGTLAHITDVQDRVLTIDAATVIGPAITAAEYQVSANAKARRWDSDGATTIQLNVDANGNLLEDGYLPLEDGVQVLFEKGTFRSGDYWQIPARTETGDVEWPKDSANKPAARLPFGIEHRYCRVALLGVTKTLVEFLDCRCLFPPACRDGVRVRRVTLGSSGLNQPGRVALTGPAIELENDTELSLSRFQAGLIVECDRPIQDFTVSRPTCFVTVEVPSNAFDTGSGTFYQTLTLRAVVSVDGSRIFYLPAPDTINPLSRALEQVSSRDRALLARLTLKGNFIWQDGAPNTFLDGDSLGIRRAADAFTGIRLPSGNGVPGGDFQMWFWLTQFCSANFPQGFVPFSSFLNISAAAPNGDRVMVGSMPPANYTRILGTAWPLPARTNEFYCGPVQLAPGRFFIAYVPTNAEKNGDFSDFQAPILDPFGSATGAGAVSFPGNIIPKARIPATFAWRVREVVPTSPYYPYAPSAEFRGVGSSQL